MSNNKALTAFKLNALSKPWRLKFNVLIMKHYFKNKKRFSIALLQKFINYLSLDLTYLYHIVLRLLSIGMSFSCKIFIWKVHFLFTFGYFLCSIELGNSQKEKENRMRRLENSNSVSFWLGAIYWELVLHVLEKPLYWIGKLTKIND